MNPDPVCAALFTPPEVHPRAYLAPGAIVLGEVVLKDLASVWYQCVLRADLQRIVIGEGSNIQDGCVIHLSSDLGTTVGAYVTVGHRAILHACVVEDEVLVGMGAILMDGVRIGARSIVGAGSLVPKGMQVPPGSLLMGSPARVVRALTPEEQSGIRHWAEKYIEVAAAHRAFHRARDSGGAVPETE